MTKSELRMIYKEKRQRLSLSQIDKYNDLILIHFQKISIPPIHCVHTYLASLRLIEADTCKLIRFLQLRNPGLKISVPRVNMKTGHMDHYNLDDQVQLVPNKFGVEEPVDGNQVTLEEIDLVLVPLMIFDKRGYRVGYGKGFYDRFLSLCRPDVISIGLSYFDPVEAISDVNEFDIPLTYCVTPQRLVHFQ